MMPPLDGADRIFADAQHRRVRAAQQVARAALVRESATRGRLAAELWLHRSRLELQARLSETQRRIDELARATGVTARRGLLFFDADFCLVSDEAAVLSALLEAALALTRAEMGNVQVLDPYGGGLRIAAQHGFYPDFLSYFALVDDERTACGAALAQARTVQVRDVATSPVFDAGPARGVVLDAGVRAVRSIPLLANGSARLGVLSVHYHRPHDPDTAERKVLAMLAAAAARRLSHRPAANP